jgi:CMP-N,N'-diacetyllegionaminic acid synthase
VPFVRALNIGQKNLPASHFNKLLIVVPARGGSKRLPGKNLRRLSGKTLMMRTTESLAAAGITAPRLLSTDDEAIAHEGKRLGWLVPFRRPASLSADDTPTVPVIVHALDWFRIAHGNDPTLVLVLQLTSPLRGAACLKRAIRMLEERPDADAVAMTRLDRAPRHIFVARSAGFVQPLLQEDTPRTLATPNGALYLVRSAILRATGTLIPPRTLPLFLDVIGSLDIDGESDWALSEAAAQAGLEGAVDEVQI